MITLQKLKWSNCFSYGADNELNLSDNTVTQVLGTNGMGKSSIPLIIEEALYNKNSKGIKKADIPNRYVNAGYHIHLEFTKDGKSMMSLLIGSLVLSFVFWKMEKILVLIQRPIHTRHSRILLASTLKPSLSWYTKTQIAVYSFLLQQIRTARSFSLIFST